MAAALRADRAVELVTPRYEPHKIHRKTRVMQTLPAFAMMAAAEFDHFIGLRDAYLFDPATDDWHATGKLVTQRPSDVADGLDEEVGPHVAGEAVDLAALAQAVESLVDLVERQPAGQQPVDGKPALSIQREVARDVARRHAGADVAALERALLAHQVDRREREGGIGRRQAGGHRGAAPAGGLIGEFERPDRAGEFEREFDPAAGGALDLLGAIRVFGVEGRGGPEFTGENELVVGEIDGDDIVYKNYYHIGVAVGTERGLVVPVVRNVDAMSFAAIEQAIAEFGRKAKDGQLTMQDMQGGTFTISNGGVFGSLLSTPIINPPQSAVLGMHRIEERPVAKDGQVVIRPMMYLALSYDHRLIDGREAVTALKIIKEAIEDPTRILIDL